MKIVTSFEGNKLPDTYGKYAETMVKNNAVISFPFGVSEIPAGTKALAWTFVDYDSIPVCGFAYIHWVVANVSVTSDSVVIAEDFSRQDKQHTHGKNSLVSKFLTTDFSDIDEGYMGPYPPDKDHAYTLTVYALDSELDLTNGFFMNELQQIAKGHILAKAELDLIGRA